MDEWLKFQFIYRLTDFHSLIQSFNHAGVLIGFLVTNECFAPGLSGSGISYISEHSSVISLIVIISILIFLILVFSLLIPKVIGFKYSDSLGKSSVKILVVLIKIFKFPGEIITKSGNLFLIPFKETTVLNLPISKRMK